MIVSKLIEELLKMPQDAKVYHLWDGALRTQIEVVYESKKGEVVTADFDEVCYDKEDRPKDLPDTEKNKYWSTPPNPNLVNDEI